MKIVAFLALASVGTVGFSQGSVGGGSSGGVSQQPTAITYTYSMTYPQPLKSNGSVGGGSVGSAPVVAAPVVTSHYVGPAGRSVTKQSNPDGTTTTVRRGWFSTWFFTR